MEAFTSYAPFMGAGGLIIALIIYLRVKSQPSGSGLMVEIAEEIHAGAMVYLKRQYSILFFVIAAIAILIWFVPSLGPGTAIAYVSGALCSVVAGYFGMMSATKANVRTAEAANRYKPDAARALSVAFNGGAVMGLSITSIGLIGIGVFFFYLNYGTPATAYEINGFAMGASSIALFMRVGGVFIQRLLMWVQTLLERLRQEFLRMIPATPVLLQTMWVIMSETLQVLAPTSLSPMLVRLLLQ